MRKVTLEEVRRQMSDIRRQNTEDKSQNTDNNYLIMRVRFEKDLNLNSDV